MDFAEIVLFKSYGIFDWHGNLDFGLLPPLLTTSMTYNVDYLLANSEFDIFTCAHHFVLLMQLARELPMISLSHVDEYAPSACTLQHKDLCWFSGDSSL